MNSAPKNTFLKSLSPCAGISFLRMMYATFGGYVTMTLLVYCLSEGFAFPMASMALKVYCFEALHMDGATSARYTLVPKVGWITKPFIGMLSDVLPLGGYRRSSYIALACMLGVLGWGIMGLLDLPAQAAVPFLVMASFSLAVPDVMIDAYTAEIVKAAPQYTSSTQSLSFCAFAVGGILASSMSGTLIECIGPQACFLVLGGCLLAILAATLCRCLPEERLPRGSRGLDVAWLRKHAPLAGLSAGMSLAAVVLTISQVFVRGFYLRLQITLAFAVMVPLGFYFVLRQVSVVLARTALFIFFNGCLQPAYADTMFQWMLKAPNGPHFSKVVLGWTHLAGSLGLLLGVWIYSNFLTRRSYRFIFALATFFTLIPSIFDLLLVTRLNLELGIPDLTLAISDDAFSDCIARLFRMPVVVLAMKACPAGMEGSVMSLVLSLGGFGHSLGVLYSSCVLEALGVVHGSYARLADAVILRGLVRLLPLLLIPMLVPAGLRPCDDVLESHGGDAGKPSGTSRGADGGARPEPRADSERKGSSPTSSADSREDGGFASALSTDFPSSDGLLGAESPLALLLSGHSPEKGGSPQASPWPSADLERSGANSSEAGRDPVSSAPHPSAAALSTRVPQSAAASPREEPQAAGPTGRRPSGDASTSGSRPGADALGSLEEGIRPELTTHTAADSCSPGSLGAAHAARQSPFDSTVHVATTTPASHICAGALTAAGHDLELGGAIL